MVFYLARLERFELPTNWFEASYSIQLSYGRAVGQVYMKFLATVAQFGRSATESYIKLLIFTVRSTSATRCLLHSNKVNPNRGSK